MNIHLILREFFFCEHAAKLFGLVGEKDISLPDNCSRAFRLVAWPIGQQPVHITVSLHYRRSEYL
jgi:hypothetical protein